MNHLHELLQVLMQLQSELDTGDSSRNLYMKILKVKICFRQ